MTGSVEHTQRNRILRAVPHDELAGVEDDFVVVEMEHGDVLFEPDAPIESVHFPLNGAVSLVAETAEGHSADVAVVGNEGFIGLPIFLGTEQMPLRAVAQVPGAALRLPTDRFRRLIAASDTLKAILLRYTQMRMVEMAQTILCNRVHPVEERTARWLLQLDERVEEAPFELTQEFFAVMLGTHRPSVSLAASKLREAGLIDYSRGVIEVLDRDGLEAAACACYRIIRNELDRLLENPASPPLGVRGRWAPR